MAVRAVFFDVGETLVDESAYWSEHARRLDLPPHVLWAALGVVIERGEHHRRVFDLLGADRSQLEEVVYDSADFYPDALPCLEALRSAGYFVGIAGNQTARLEQWTREQSLPVDVIASSASWGVEKPAPEFFARACESAACEPRETAYVGDRVDNDVVPATEAGLVAVHVRRGPWGYLQQGAERARVRVGSLAELPEALSRV
ncbi:MAG: HAD family hydrolase [Gaiellaceae bacterium]